MDSQASTSGERSQPLSQGLGPSCQDAGATWGQASCASVSTSSSSVSACGASACGQRCSSSTAPAVQDLLKLEIGEMKACLLSMWLGRGL